MEEAVRAIPVDVGEILLAASFTLIKQLFASIRAMLRPNSRAGQVLQPCHENLVELAAGHQYMYMTMTMTMTAARGSSSLPQACIDESHRRTRPWLPRRILR